MSPRVIARDLLQPEGPVCLVDGSIVLVEMDERRECVTHVDTDGRRRAIVRPGGRPTGLALDAEGCWWVAGGPNNSLVKLAPDGRQLLLIQGDERGPFLFPNDLAFGPNGLLYLTDSGMRPSEFITGLSIRTDFYTAPYDGAVFEIDPRGGHVLRRLATGLRFANGIAFGLDSTLYFNESLTGNVWRLRVDDASAKPEVFANVLLRTCTDRFVGPDGMAFDERGNLYCTVYGQGEVTVIAPDGRVVERVQTLGRLPTNIAFSVDKPSFVVTEVEHGALELWPAPHAGLPLHIPECGSIDHTKVGVGQPFEANAPTNVEIS